MNVLGISAVSFCLWKLVSAFVPQCAFASGCLCLDVSVSVGVCARLCLGVRIRLSACIWASVAVRVSNFVPDAAPAYAPTSDCVSLSVSVSVFRLYKSLPASGCLCVSLWLSPCAWLWCVGCFGVPACADLYVYVPFCVTQCV